VRQSIRQLNLLSYQFYDLIQLVSIESHFITNFTGYRTEPVRGSKIQSCKASVARQAKCYRFVISRFLAHNPVFMPLKMQALRERLKMKFKLCNSYL